MSKMKVEWISTPGAGNLPVYYLDIPPAFRFRVYQVELNRWRVEWREGDWFFRTALHDPSCSFTSIIDAQTAAVNTYEEWRRALPVLEKS